MSHTKGKKKADRTPSAAPAYHHGEQQERSRSTVKTRKSVETRRRIMDVTAQIMLERGNTAFRMSEVSKRCDMSKGALYYYFADKEDLLQAIYDEEVDALVQAIDDAVADADSAQEALRGACHAFAECVRDGGPLAMALVRELVLARDDEGAVNSRLNHIIGVVAEQLSREKAEGIARPDVDVQLAAFAVCGAYAFAAMGTLGDAVTSAANEDKTSDEGDPSDEDKPADEPTPSTDFADRLFDMILFGMGTPAAR